MIKLLQNVSLKNYTLIVPSVSVGNVGQLAVDLLISTLELTKIGYVWHSSILPITGGDPFGDSSTISTACELYSSTDLQLVVLQIRSAFSKTSNEFVQNLCDWIKSVEIKQVVILTGSFAHERRDNQLIGEPLRYIFCPITESAEGNNAVSRKWIQLEKKGSYIGESEANFCPLIIPGSGSAVKLFDKCVEEKIPCSILTEFCSDGNNAPDALKLADYLDEWLALRVKVQKEVWTHPPSWILLFGPLPPIEIFN